MNLESQLKKDECPDFEHNDFEPIIEWAGAKVWWSDVAYHSDGAVVHNPTHASWGFSWENGGISWDSLHEDNEKNKIIARRASALFIYLWCRGIAASLADNLAISYARNVRVSTLVGGNVIEDLLEGVE